MAYPVLLEKYGLYHMKKLSKLAAIKRSEKAKARKIEAKLTPWHLALGMLILNHERFIS